MIDAFASSSVLKSLFIRTLIAPSLKRRTMQNSPISPLSMRHDYSFCFRLDMAVKHPLDVIRLVGQQIARLVDVLRQMELIRDENASGNVFLPLHISSLPSKR